jgi:hypothetical protein
MMIPDTRHRPHLLDERSTVSFRQVFGEILSCSTAVETAILRIRLSGVDLTAKEVASVRTFRVLVAEVSARTVEDEAYALLTDPEKRQNLARILALLRSRRMEIRSAPLGGWSPDFSVFHDDRGPACLLIGLHLFRPPFPNGGPSWAARLGPEAARRAHVRFEEIWRGAHEIGHPVQGIMERAARLAGRAEPTASQTRESDPAEAQEGQEESPTREATCPVDTPRPPG